MSSPQLDLTFAKLVRQARRAKVAFAKLYDRKNVLVAADLLNDGVFPFLEER